MPLYWTIDSKERLFTGNGEGDIAAQTAAKARAARSTYAGAASASARAVVRDVQASGVTTLKGIAAALQARGIRTGQRRLGTCSGVPVNRLGKLHR